MAEEFQSALGGVKQVAASRDVQGSPWGGGGFVDYGGAAAESFQQSYDQQEMRQAYEKSVRDEETKELDADFGKLVSTPSGVGGFDGAAETMAREWKAEYVQIKRAYDRGEIDPSTFSQEKSRLFGNAGQFKAASKNLQTIVADYEKAVQDGTVSNSTPAEIRDVLDTLRKGGETLTVQNVDGVPTLIGKTLQGMDVSTPISEIASGKNVWRFNNKFNTGEALGQLYTKYEALKVDEQAADGTVTRRNPSYEELLPRIQEDVTNVLNNESTVRAIAGDELNIGALEFEQDPEGAKQAVADHLLQKLQTTYYPTQQIQQRSFAPQRPTQTRGASAAEIKAQQSAAQAQQNAQILSNALTPDGAGNYPNAQGLIGVGGITKIKPFRFSDGFYAYVGDEKYEIYPNEPGGQQILANLLGLGAVNNQPSEGASSDDDPLGIN